MTLTIRNTIFSWLTRFCSTWDRCWPMWKLLQLWQWELTESSMTLQVRSSFILWKKYFFKYYYFTRSGWPQEVAKNQQEINVLISSSVHHAIFVGNMKPIITNETAICECNWNAIIMRRKLRNNKLVALYMIIRWVIWAKQWFAWEIPWKKYKLATCLSWIR